MDEIDPFLIASLYAQNRWDVKHILNFWISKGYNIILDRYIVSNVAYQGARTFETRGYTLQEIYNFEHNILGIPKTYHTVYLDLPEIVAKKALLCDDTRKALDQNELASSDYKKMVRTIYKEHETVYENFTTIDCFGKNGFRLSIEDVHNCLYDILKDKFVNQHM